MGSLKPCSNQEEGQSQPGDWKPENREEHERGRRERWVRGREQGAENRTRDGKARQTKEGVLKAIQEERGQEEQ